MKGMRARRGLAAAMLCALVATGCTSDRPVDGDPAGAPSQTSQAAPDATAAGTLRLRLERQFATFGHRLLEASRARKADRESAAKSVSDAVDELAGTVGTVYDDEAAERFESELDAWTTRVFDHARSAVGERRDSRRALLATADDVAAAMADITDDGMEADGTAALLREPLRATAASVDAHADDDFEQAYLHNRMAYADMVSVGQAFAAGISEQLPDRYAGPRSSGPLELQSALQQLLVEHALLTGVVTRRGAKGTRDFDAAASALNGNTEDLATALDSIYGGEASAFTGAWRDRISSLADYTVAAAEQRDRRQRAMRDELRAADRRIGNVVAELLEDAVSPQEVTAGVRQVTDAMLDHVDGYVAKRRDESRSAQVRGEAAAAELGILLADGIVAHRPNDFVAP